MKVYGLPLLFSSPQWAGHNDSPVLQRLQWLWRENDGRPQLSEFAILLSSAPELRYAAKGFFAFTSYFE
jgi:hypothetical protein